MDAKVGWEAQEEKGLAGRVQQKERKTYIVVYIRWHLNNKMRLHTFCEFVCPVKLYPSSDKESRHEYFV
jgi:hypothetical protein